jgi:hypothetical protein
MMLSAVANPVFSLFPCLPNVSGKDRPHCVNKQLLPEAPEGRCVEMPCKWRKSLFKTIAQIGVRTAVPL